MKRIGAIVCLAALTIMMTASVCFGAQSQKLEIVDMYPEDGQKNTSIENMSVKLHFNNEMGNEASAKANAKAFSITDDEGKQIPIRIFYNPKDSKEVMVLADTVKLNDNGQRLKDNTKYTLHISGDVTDNDGNALGTDQTVTFTTLNQGQNTKVYMIMMVIMFGGMFFFTSRQAKRQMAKQEEEVGREEPFNPYKEAKKTGKSVQEVIAAHEKEVAKREAKAAKKAKRAASDEDEDDYYEEESGNYKVKGPRPISAGGSSYVTGRKALAEERLAEEERLAKRRAANSKKKKKK